MSIILLYLLKSTICMSGLYLVFRVLMRKQTFFQLNRVILLSIVGFSVIIPLVQLPQTIQPVVSFQWTPVADKIEVYELNLPAESALTGQQDAGQPMETTSPQIAIAWPKLLQMIYLSGLFVALLVSLIGFLHILMLFRKVPVISKEGFRLLIAPNDIPAFSLGSYLFISKSDFETNGDTILTHEKAHILHGHFYDLLLLEAVKIIYWFNPVIYWLTRDLKAVHEFQADDSALNYGIDATQYQLLIIQKCVGHQKFALANSFNHCQIKNRIVMMNKQKSNKAWRWTAAAFVPMLALLLMAFGRTGENSPPESFGSSTLVAELKQDSVKQWSEGDFGTLDQIGIWIKSNKIVSSNWYAYHVQIDSKSQLHTSNSMQNKICSLKEIPDHVRSYLDFELADEKSKMEFKKITINGQEKMMSRFYLMIKKDQDTPDEDYQILLNIIGNTILEVRGKFANEVFKTPYTKLTSAQRDDIDMLIPALATFHQSPIQAGITFKIEIRKDGNYIDNKVCSLEELRKRVESWQKMNPNGITSLKAEDEVPMIRINEVKDVLRNAKVPNIKYSRLKPEDKVYSVVEDMPRFPGGEKALREWIGKTINYPEKAKARGIQGKVFANFVVNTEGKVVDARIIRSIDPELDAEALRVVLQMPVWIPGRQKGEPVSVSYTVPITFSI